MLIGDLAKKAGVSIDTIRYYERQGLIAPQKVRNSGYRDFNATAPERLIFIRSAKKLGFSLKEIRALLLLRENSDATCGDVRHLAEEKLQDVQLKITALRDMEQELSFLIKECQSASLAVTECPILGALEEGQN